METAVSKVTIIKSVCMGNQKASRCSPIDQEMLNLTIKAIISEPRFRIIIRKMLCLIL